MNQSNQFYILIFYSSINLSIFYTSSVHPINQYLTLSINQSIIIVHFFWSINMQVATLNMIYYLHWRIYSAFFGLQYISTPHCSHCRIFSILRAAVHLEEVVGGSGTQPADDWWSRDYSEQGHGLFIAQRIEPT